MKQVWKCDFCSDTDVDSDVISMHEPQCSFNKATKTCFTCKHATDEGYSYSIPGCLAGSDVHVGQDTGNCKEWVYEHLEEDRDKLLTNIGI